MSAPPNAAENAKAGENSQQNQQQQTGEASHALPQLSALEVSLKPRQHLSDTPLD